MNQPSEFVQELLKNFTEATEEAIREHLLAGRPVSFIRDGKLITIKLNERQLLYFGFYARHNISVEELIKFAELNL